MNVLQLGKLHLEHDLHEAGFHYEYPNFDNNDMLVMSEDGEFNVLIKQAPVDQWLSRTDVAIHVLQPDFTELMDAFVRAECQMFETIVIYR